MNIILKTFDRCGYPIFVALAFLTLPLWFPILWVWVVIDPPYCWKMWRKKYIKPITQPNSRALAVSFSKDFTLGTISDSRRNYMAENPDTTANKKP